MPPSGPMLPTQVVTEDEIRKQFNDGKYLERIDAGEFQPRVDYDSHPSHPKGDEPFCTRSQIIYYYNRDGMLVTVVHQYVRPDGTIGLSGKPDPKRLVLQDRIIYVRTEPIS